jgi:hypothetical protein
MLESLLAEGRPLSANRATGANLFAMSMTKGDSPIVMRPRRRERT